MCRARAFEIPRLVASSIQAAEYHFSSSFHRRTTLSGSGSSTSTAARQSVCWSSWGGLDVGKLFRSPDRFARCCWPFSVDAWNCGPWNIMGQGPLCIAAGEWAHGLHFITNAALLTNSKLPPQDMVHIASSSKAITCIAFCTETLSLPYFSLSLVFQCLDSNQLIPLVTCQTQKQAPWNLLLYFLKHYCLPKDTFTEILRYPVKDDEIKSLNGLLLQLTNAQHQPQLWLQG